jgi:hypothetical protein
MEGLIFELPIGLNFNGETHKEVELLTTNGVAEKIFVKKIAEKPFTWQGNIVSAAVKRIGNVEIGSDVRKKYLEEGAVTIPTAVLKLPLAEINTLLVEIHRRVWVSFIPKQEIICKYCGRKLIVDIDLDKIDYLPEVKEQMESMPDYSLISVTLKDGFVPPVIPKLTDKEQYAGITDTTYNRFTFRVPLLEDAIRHEKYFSDSIGFWRRIALDCLKAVEQVDENGEVVDTLPKEFHTYYGLKMFNEILSGRDLKEIRTQLTEFLPTLPFAYYEPCGCDDAREIPMVMEASNFFSE